MIETCSEQTRKRNENRCKLLTAVHRHKRLTKTEISGLCNLRKSSITNIVAELLEARWLVECEPGRVRSHLALNPDSWFFLSIILTGTHVTFARVNLLGQLQTTASCEITDSNPAPLCNLMVEGILSSSAQGKPLAIGVAFPGMVDSAAGKVIYAAKFSNWSNIELGALLHSRVGGKIIVVNDVRAQLRCAQWFGGDFKPCANTLFLNISDGVSCALSIHDREVQGAQNAAGEIGHVAAGEEKRECGCGKLDCLEAYCSIPAISTMINSQFPGLDSCAAAEDIFNLMQADRRIENVVDRCSARIARILTPLMAAVDPELVLLATPHEGFTGFLAQSLQNYLKVGLAGIPSRRAEVLAAEPVAEGSFKGAAALLIEQYFQSGDFITVQR